MTDRELLEAAARAAGRTIVDWIPNASTAPDGAGCDVAVLDGGSYFQPLHDNRLTDCMGDALRLVVKLLIRVDVTGDISRATYGLHDLGVCGDCYEPLGADAGAATRRAIVRAAAAMAPKTGGRSMIGHFISLDRDQAGRLGYMFSYHQVLEPRHFGPPPSAGWWPVSFFDAYDPSSCSPALRWWNGSCWSVPVEPECPADLAAHCAESAALLQCGLFWLRKPQSWGWPNTDIGRQRAGWGRG